MRYAVVGGDRRSVLLAEQLQREGHRVHSFALEKAELPAGIYYSTHPEITPYK